jgi:hypothetical protein
MWDASAVRENLYPTAIIRQGRVDVAVERQRRGAGKATHDSPHVS